MSRFWYIEHKGKTLGPVSSAQLRQLASARKITHDTRVQLGGSNEWVPASKVQGLFSGADLTGPVQELVQSNPVMPSPFQQVAVADPRQHEIAQRRLCPFCGEDIALSAIKCRHCSEFLDGRPRETYPPQYAAPVQHVVNVTQVTHVRRDAYPRWNPGVAALLSFFIPGLGQLYKGQIANGAVWFVVTIIGYMTFIVPGLVLHLCCVLGAASGNPYR